MYRIQDYPEHFAPATQTLLAAAGIETIRHLASYSANQLEKVLKETCNTKAEDLQKSIGPIKGTRTTLPTDFGILVREIASEVRELVQKNPFILQNKGDGVGQVKT